MKIQVDDVSIEIYRKRIKNLNLYVKPPCGRVVISAPLSMSNTVIEGFIHKKIGWIKKQIHKFENQPPQLEHVYLTEDKLKIWGKSYAVQKEYGNKNALEFFDNTVVLTVRRGSTEIQQEKFIREWYREQLKGEIARKLTIWEGITGLKTSGWQTKHMKTRWGTCNTGTGKIWLNLQLAKKEPICLDYVLLHETVHLAQRNHGKKFVALMDKYMPNWREIKIKLNR